MEPISMKQGVTAHHGLLLRWSEQLVLKDQRLKQPKVLLPRHEKYWIGNEQLFKLQQVYYEIVVLAREVKINFQENVWVLILISNSV